MNTAAPLWGNQVTPPAGALELQVRNGIERVQQERAPTELFGQRAKDARAIFEDVDAKLHGISESMENVDAALKIPKGTTRQLTLERALVEVGVADAASIGIVRGAEGAAATSRLVGTVRDVVKDRQPLAEDISVELARIADRLVQDENLEKAFMVGYVGVPEVLQDATTPVVRVVHALIDAKLRHDRAIYGLKFPRTANPVIDVTGRVLGETADLLAHGIAFFGPWGALRMAQGADFALVVGESVLAKTATKGTEKTMLRYTDLPEEISAFLLGVVAATTSRDQAGNAVEGAYATSSHIQTTVQELRAAVQAGNSDDVRRVVAHAAATMTDAERSALTSAARRVAEHAVTAGA